MVRYGSRSRLTDELRDSLVIKKPLSGAAGGGIGSGGIGVSEEGAIKSAKSASYAGSLSRRTATAPFTQGRQGETSK
jgi:hypothetical protein